MKCISRYQSCLLAGLAAATVPASAASAESRDRASFCATRDLSQTYEKTWSLEVSELNLETEFRGRFDVDAGAFAQMSTEFVLEDGLLRPDPDTAISRVGIELGRARLELDVTLDDPFEWDLFGLDILDVDMNTIEEAEFTTIFTDPDEAIAVLEFDLPDIERTFEIEEIPIIGGCLVCLEVRVGGRVRIEVALGNTEIRVGDNISYTGYDPFAVAVGCDGYRETATVAAGGNARGIVEFTTLEINVDSPFGDSGWQEILDGDDLPCWEFISGPEASLEFSTSDIDLEGEPTLACGVCVTGDDCFVASETTCLTQAGLWMQDACCEDIEGTVAHEGHGGRYGTAVCNLGDVDGDGHDDYAVGAPMWNGDRGRVYVYSGHSGLAMPWSPLRGCAGPCNERFGYAVAGSDVNGDGRADIVVGAPLNDQLAMNAGKVYVYSGVDGSFLYNRKGRSKNDRFGWSVAGGADLNCDGFEDFVVGAPFNSDDGLRSGKVYAYSGLDKKRIGELSGNTNKEQAGRALAFAGDLNQDGIQDILIGAPYFKNGNKKKAGRMYAWAGHSFDIIGSKKGSDEDALFGFSVAAAGDMDGDGTGDFAVGQPLADRPGRPEAGQVHVFSGRTLQVIFRKRGSDTGTRLGWSVAPAGDLDDDDTPDLLIGAPGHNGLAGRIFLLSGDDQDYLGWFDGGTPGGRCGEALAWLGDIDADCAAEFVAGAPRAMGQAGRAYQFDADMTTTTEAAPGPAAAPVGSAWADLDPEMEGGLYHAAHVR